MAFVALRNLQRYRVTQLWYISRNFSDVNRGMNAAVFRSVFEPIKPHHKLAQRRYRLRWDWHLRNFIYALITPAATYGMVLAIRLFMADDIKAFEESKLQAKEAEEAKEDRVITIEERIQVIEATLKQVELERHQSEVVKQAKIALKEHGVKLLSDSIDSADA